MIIGVKSLFNIWIIEVDTTSYEKHNIVTTTRVSRITKKITDRKKESISKDVN